jgi:hypothetical protein
MMADRLWCLVEICRSMFWAFPHPPLSNLYCKNARTSHGSRQSTKAAMTHISVHATLSSLCPSSVITCAIVCLQQFAIMLYLLSYALRLSLPHPCPISVMNVSLNISSKMLDRHWIPSHGYYMSEWSTIPLGESKVKALALTVCATTLLLVSRTQFNVLCVLGKMMSQTAYYDWESCHSNPGDFVAEVLVHT